MSSAVRILLSVSDPAVAATMSEYLRLRNYAPQMIQRLTMDELWIEAPLLIVDEESLATYDQIATLPPALILLGNTAPGEPPAKVAHLEHIPLPLRLSDLGKAISKLLTRAAISPESISLAADLFFYPKERALRRQSTSQSIELTEKEAGLLSALLQSRGQTAGRDALLKEVWRYQSGVDTHTLETHIYRLRQKITEIGGNEKIIATVPEGYLLEAAPELIS